MKKFLKFSGIISALLAIVAFILILATAGIMSGSDIVAKGTSVIFGKAESGSIGGFSWGKINLAWSGLLAWIFILLALLILIAGIVLPLLKVKTPVDKFAGLLNLIAVCLLVVAGIFIFITLPVFCSANGWKEVPEQWTLGAGWVIAGILAISAGVIAILPAAMDFLGKKK